MMSQHGFLQSQIGDRRYFQPLPLRQLTPYVVKKSQLLKFSKSLGSRPNEMDLCRCA